MGENKEYDFISLFFGYAPACGLLEGGREGMGEGGAYRAMAPAEHTAIGAGEGRSHLHALVGGDAVEGVLVAAASATKLVLGPAAKLDGGVGANELVALLRQLLSLWMWGR